MVQTRRFCVIYINFVNGPDQIVYIVPDGVMVRTLERQRVRVPPFRFEVTTLGKLIIQLPLSHTYIDIPVNER